MIKTLQGISKKAILLNEFDFTVEQTKSGWLGSPGADKNEISAAEERLNVKLPDDYIEFLEISNGFPQYSTISCSLLPVSRIDYLKVVDEDLIEVWNQFEGLEEAGQALASSILVGGLKEEQYFLLIPPKTKSGKWGYWKFASWIPGEEKFKSLKDYFKSELSFLEEHTKDLKTIQPKSVIDYSLRDAVFNLDWNTVYSIASNFIIEGKRFGYFNPPDLFALLLIAAGKENNFDSFEKLIHTFKFESKSGINTPYLNLNSEYLLGKYEEAARNKVFFVPEFQANKNFSEKAIPMNLDQIEKQIEESRKDLLKEKNKFAKIGYQLYFLFHYGSSTDFIGLYEQNHNDLFFAEHLNAAIVYATLQQPANARNAIKRYFRSAFNYRPFDPFLSEALFPLLDSDALHIN